MTHGTIMATALEICLLTALTSFATAEDKPFKRETSAAQDDPSSSTNLLSRIKEPVVLKGDSTIAYRDPTAVWHDGKLFLYFSVC